MKINPLVLVLLLSGCSLFNQDKAPKSAPAAAPVSTQGLAEAAPAPLISFPSISGILSPPFKTSGQVIFQPETTALTNSGMAVYHFTVVKPGSYTLSILVSAATTATNSSVWINIDKQPEDPTMIWDIPLSEPQKRQEVTWRGKNVAIGWHKSPTPQFNPKVFNLTVGAHKLIIRGRAAFTQLGQITVVPSSLPAN